jgi:hypothetical protein
MSRHTVNHQLSQPASGMGSIPAKQFATGLSVGTRYLTLIALILAIIAGGRSAHAVVGPNNAYVVNNFVPKSTCIFGTLIPIGGINCEWYITDTKANWSSSSAFLGLDDYAPSSCIVWLISCSFQYNYIHLSGSNSVTLTPPAIHDISNGVTFEIRVVTRARSSVSQVGTMLTMPGVFAINTIGPRWGLHTYQESPEGVGSGFDLTPWEPYNHGGNVNIYEDIYYTFTPDGRLRIDKFTPYRNGTTAPTYYIWEESINDGGWPSTWVNGQQTFVPVGTLILGGNGNPSGIDAFRQLEVYNTALTQDQMINQENFYHPAGANLATGMSPCNTGNWINAATVSTPCGNGGNHQPVPLPPTNVPGFSLSTDTFAPGLTFYQDSNGINNFTITNPPQAPPLSLLQDPTQPPPWSPFYPVTPTGLVDYLVEQDVTGIYSCQSAYPTQGDYYPGGRVLQMAIGANYPETSLDGPDTITTTAQISNPPSTVPLTNLVNTTLAGWQCTKH